MQCCYSQERFARSIRGNINICDVSAKEVWRVHRWMGRLQIDGAFISTERRESNLRNGCESYSPTIRSPHMTADTLLATRSALVSRRGATRVKLKALLRE